MGLITLVIILAVCVSIVINTTVDSLTKEYKARFGAEVTLYLDAQKAREYDDVRVPSAQQQMDIANSEYLQRTEQVCTVSVALKGLKALDEDATGSIGSFDGGDTLPPNAKVMASSNPAISEEFKNGTRSIVSGRAYEHPGECIVSEEFAKQNGLAVGDTVTVTNTQETALMPQTLAISGIYQDHLPKGNPGLNHPLFNRGNEILTDMKSLMQTELFRARGEMASTYYLKDPEMLEAFQKQASEKGLAPYYRAATDEKAYNRIVGPVEGISKIVTVFLVVVLALGGAILLFLSVMAVRERRYEIGVLRAMGMKRLRVIAGMVCESLIIAAACLVIGLGASTVLSQPAADLLLEDQLRIAQEQEQNRETLILSPGKEEPDTIAEITVKLTPQAIVQISTLALLLVLISSMAGILYITRYEPMKILSERG